MNRKTILSSHFPDFVMKWKRFQHKFKQIDSWYIVSDYCLDDRNKLHDVMTFTLYPFTNPYLLKKGIKQHLSKDIKDFKHLSEKAISYIKESPYFFSLAFITEGKNDVFKLNDNKQLLDNAIKGMENWPKTKKKNLFIK